MSKKSFYFIICCLFSVKLFAQTGIGTTTPNSSAKLDVYSDNKGFLPPRVTLTSATDNTTVPNAAEGLLVYNKGSVGLQAGYYYWNGANWATIATATSAGNGVTAMDMVKLYGEAHSSAAGKISSSTGYVFTVPVSGRYLFDFTSSGTALSGGTTTFYFQVRQGTTVLGTDMQSSYNNNVHVEYNGKVEVNLQAGVSYNVYNYTTSGSFEANDYDRVYYKMVAGNLPITGQTVDYVSVTRSESDQTVNSGDVIVFNTIDGGNIPYNTSTGLFTLTAGKTYKLIAGVSLSNGNGSAKEVNINWKNAAGNILGSKGELLSPSANVTAAGGGIAYAVYTPLTNTTVGLYVNYSSASTLLWQNFTFASIEQIGSSAIINPWTLSGTNTYNTTGNVGIGKTSPSTSLHIENGNLFGTDPSSTSSPSLYLLNSNNTSSSAHASALIRSAGSSGGNPYLSFDIMGVRGYSMGIDNADADKFKFHTNWNLNNSITPAITITTDARVGIGTTNPSAPLHVASNVTQYVGSYGYLNTGGASTYTLNGNTAYSIQSDARIRASEFNAISDFRIKKDIVKSNTSNQLTELSKFNVVTYKYIDNLVNGNKNKTGFIAQEVEQVNPRYVNHSSDFIPSVFALANSANLNNDLLQIIIDKPHGFEKGDLVKFFVEGKKEVVKTIEEVLSTHSFSINGWNEATNNLFIYGKKVNDFRAIDFDQITALSVGAIQELSKKIDKLEVENDKLKKLINEIEI